jgi:hypothetical protein
LRNSHQQKAENTRPMQRFMTQARDLKAAAIRTKQPVQVSTKPSGLIASTGSAQPAADNARAP